MATTKDGNGGLFVNDKGDNPNRPDFRGDIKVGGKLYRLSGWKKAGAKGTYISLTATPEPELTLDLNDDIAF